MPSESDVADDLLTMADGGHVLRRLVHASPVAVVVVALAERRVVDANEAFLHLTGLTRQEVIGADEAALGLRLGRDQAGAVATVGDLVGRRDLEVTVRAKNGGERFALLTVAAVTVAGDAHAVAHLLDVRPQREAAAKLRASEELFRHAFDAAATGMSILARDGRYLRVNPAFCALTGYSEADLLSRTFQQITHPDDLAADRRDLQRLRDGDLPTFRTEKRYVRPDGSTVWAQVSSTLVRDAAGAPSYVVSQVEDISARKEAEAALAAERDLLQTLMDTLPDAVYVKDAASRFRRLNPATARTLGIDDPAAAIGKTDFDFVPESLARRYFADEQQVIATGQPLLNRLEPQRADEDGGEWWLTSTVPLRDASGEIVGIVGAGRNITERLRTEAALRESEARLRAVLAALPDLVVRLNRAGTFLDYQAERAADLAAPPEIFLGRTIAEVLPPDVSTMISAAIGQVLARGGIETIEFELEVTTGRRAFEARLVASGPDEVVAVVRDVTERTQAGAELRAAEERYRGLVERLPAIVTINAADAGNATLYASPQVETLFGDSPADLVADPDLWLARVHPDDRDRVQAAIAEANRRGGPFCLEYRRYARDGRLVWLRDTGVLVRDAAGAPAVWQSVLVDITDQKRVEQELRAAEARYRALVERLPAVVYTVAADALGVAHYISPQIEPLLGFRPAEWLADPDLWVRQLHPDDRERVLAEHAAAERARAPLSTEYRYLARDGRVVWVRDELAPVPGADGVVASWQGFLLEITAQKQAEAALRASEERLHLALEAAGMLTWDRNVATERVFRSPGAPALFGLPPEASTANRDVYLARIHPDDRAAYAEADRRREAGGPYQVEFRIIRPDGEERWLRDRGEVYLGPDGRPVRFLGVTQDVTDEKRAEAELRAAKEAAEEASRLKSAFLSTMSHELRTPLNAIIGYAHLLLDGLDGELTAEQAGDVRRIAEGADRLLGLIDGVLDLARIEAGGLELAAEAIAPAAVVEAVLAQAAPLAARKGLSLAADLPPALPTVLGDPFWLHQALLNLVGNAIKFTERGGLTVAAREAAGGVALVVADTGIGIAPEHLPHIFDEFRQADAGTTRRYGGTGLGLAIAKRLVEAHGGTIQAESQPGVGSAFTLWLPAVDES